MGTLENHVKQNCDPQLIGLLSLSIKEAYRFLENLKKDNPLLQRREMNKTYGHLRNGLVDIGLKEVFSYSNLPHKIADETTSQYRNGHTYLMVEVKGAILTTAKVSKPHHFPKPAKNRTYNSLKNRQYNLFSNPEDLNQVYDENNPPYMILTYGGKNHQLEFVRLGLPRDDASGWIDMIDITNVPALLKNESQISEDLTLTFTKEAERIIQEGDESAKGKVV